MVTSQDVQSRPAYQIPQVEHGSRASKANSLRSARLAEAEVSGH